MKRLAFQDSGDGRDEETAEFFGDEGQEITGVQRAGELQFLCG